MNTRALRAALALLATLLAACPPAPCQWTNDPWNGMVPVCTAAGWQTSPQICRLSSGRYLILWLDYREGFSNYRTYYQILDSDGVTLLQPNGILVFDCTWYFSNYKGLISDGAGGCIAFLYDDRNSTGYVDLYGQRFDSLGNRMWGETGLPLVEWPGAQDISAKDVVSDSLGNVFLSLLEGEGMYIQKCNTMGERLWGDYGMPVNIAAGIYDYQQSVPDGQGGIIDVWMDTRPGGGADPSNLWAQHLDSQGNPLWALNGIRLSNPHTGAYLWAYSIADGVPDGHGGGIWAYDTHYNWYLFRLTGAGQIIWYSSNFAPDTCYVVDLLRHPVDNTLWVSNKEKRTGRNWDWYLYRFNLNGNPLFGNYGLSLGGVLTPTSNGVICLKSISEGNPDYLKAQRVDSSGTVAWNTLVNYNQGSVTGTGYGYKKGVADGTDGIICVWEDQRDWDFDIYAQRVQANGGLGDPLPTPPHAPDYPRFNLYWTGKAVRFTLLQAGEIHLELFDLLGRRVAEVAAGYYPLGYHEVKLNQPQLSSGIYVLRLTAAAQAQALKIALIK